jgi:hypothetical protein
MFAVAYAFSIKHLNWLIKYEYLALAYVFSITNFNSLIQYIFLFSLVYVFSMTHINFKLPMYQYYFNIFLISSL